jgi:O-antigen ligase
LIETRASPYGAGATVFTSTAPIALAGLLASLLVGVLLARNTSLGIAALIGICYVPIVFLNLPLGIVLWIPLAFVSRVEQTGLASTLVILLIAAAWFGSLPSTGAHVVAVLRRHAVMFSLLLLLVGWITASIVWASDADAALRDFWGWWVSGAILLIIATTIATRRHVVGICLMFVLGALITVAIAIAQGTANEAALATQSAGRLGAGLQDPNFLAAGLVPATALAAGLLPFARSGPVRIALLGALGALGVAIVATGSRGGLVAVVIAAVAALVIGRGRRLQIAGILAVALVIATGWIVSSSPTEVLDRVKDFEGGSGRVDLWEIALRITAEHPFAGIGVGNFVEEASQYILQPGRLEDAAFIVAAPRVVHNVYLQQLAETGIMGLALYLGFVVAAIAAAWGAIRRFERAGDRSMADLSRAVVVAVIGGMAVSIFITNGYDPRQWILLALGPALMSVAVRARGSEA